MELDGGSWSRACACTKVFYQPNSYSNHVRTCAAHKKGLTKSLENAKDRYAKKKKHKKGKEAIESWYGEDLDVDQVPDTNTDVSIVALELCEGLLTASDYAGTW
jgi:uncharacterized C2H2 Zn-finger protein